MDRFRKPTIFLFAAIIFYFVATEFSLEILALSWHARHGKTATLKSSYGGTYGVPVPALWMAIVDDGGWGVGIHKTPGRIRAYLHETNWAMMSFSVAPSYQTANEMRRIPPIIYSKTGMVFVELTSVTAAEQKLYCFEQRFEKGELADLAKRYNTVDLYCAPESDKRGFSASYTGSPALVPKFYEVLQGVTREQTVAQR